MTVTAQHRVPVETELVLLLAGSVARRRATDQRIRELAGQVDPEALDQNLARHGIALVAGSRLVAMGLAPRGLKARLRRARELSEIKASAVGALTAHALQRLEESGVPAIPLKGPALAVAAHGSAGMRNSADIDILVGADRLAEAVRSLADLGYTSDVDAPRSSIHLLLRHPSPGRPPIELHWRVHWYGDALAGRLLREGTEDPAGVRQLKPAAGLVALLLFYARDGFAGLRLAVDIAAYLDVMGGQIQADDVLELAAFDSEVRPALRAAGAAAARIVGASAPQLGPMTRSEQFACRLADWRLDGDSDQARAVIRLVDALLTPPGRRHDFAPARFTPFAMRRRNLAYMAKTMIRWVPATASAAGGRYAHPLPHSVPSTD